MSVREVILDGEKIISEEDFHLAISKSLDFGPYYGHNLDALWDRLSTDVERPITIIWVNSDSSKKYLGETFHKIIGIFEENRQQDLICNMDERFDYILK